eukprot:1797496-Rhodomonas_salina.1
MQNSSARDSSAAEHSVGDVPTHGMLFDPGTDTDPGSGLNGSNNNWDMAMLVAPAMFVTLTETNIEDGSTEVRKVSSPDVDAIWFHPTSIQGRISHVESLVPMHQLLHPKSACPKRASGQHTTTDRKLCTYGDVPQLSPKKSVPT